MYVFTPPTVDYRVGSHPLWGRINHQRGLAVVVYGTGSVQTLHDAPSIDGTTVTAVYDSGRTYEISDAEAATLEAAGYGDHLEVVA